MLFEATGTRISLTSMPSMDLEYNSSLAGSLAKIVTRSQPTRRCTSSRTEMMISSRLAVWMWSVTSRIRRSVSSFAESSSRRAITSSPAFAPSGFGMQCNANPRHLTVNPIRSLDGLGRRNHLRDPDREVVVDDEHFPARDEPVVHEDVDRIAHQVVEPDDRARTEFQHVLHVQLRVAELDADLHVHIGQEVQAGLRTGRGGRRLRDGHGGGRAGSRLLAERRLRRRRLPGGRAGEHLHQLVDVFLARLVWHRVLTAVPAVVSRERSPG